ncbi:MAG: hypothetical protein GXO69_10900 [Acidobacteria bacterium]|nr:hypothetical protein [Acidobacteriota bacterium]
MNRQDVIDGWKSISSYLGKSVKTIQRWEKESAFPVHRVPGHRSVFFLKDEVDSWLEQREKMGKVFTDSPENNVEKLSGAFWLRRVFLPLLVLVTIAGGVIVARNVMKEMKAASGLGALSVKLVPYSEGSMLTVKNAYGNSVLRVRFQRDWCMFALLTPGVRMWKVVDLNHDGLDDLLMVNPEKAVPAVGVFMQRSDGTLRWKRNLTVNEKIRCEGTLFDMERIHCIDVMDLDGDNVPEVLLTVYNRTLYPSVLVVMTLQGNRLLVIEHPGHFRNVQARRIRGRTVVYAAGTNNYIAKYSEPVVLRVSMDWHRRGVYLSLIRPGRKLAPSVPAGVSLTYARLGDFPEQAGVSVWEPAVIRSFDSRINDRHVYLDAGFYDIRKIKGTLLSRSSPFMKIRLFELNEKLLLIRSGYNDVLIDLLGIKPKEELYRSLLIPRYWNGQGWQDTVCTLPQCLKTSE